VTTSVSRPAATRRMTHMQAVVDAIASEMRQDQTVLYIGQDVGPMGGSMQGTQGLFEEFGPRRVREAPIAESGMLGVAIGAALYGLRPIVEVSFGEFLPAAMNQLINQAPNLRYMTGGAATVPVVIRTRVGDGPYGGHPQDYSAWFAHVPGLKVVMPATPADARGLMLAAIRDPNPVVFFEPMSLSHAARDEVAPSDEPLAIGPACVARPGSDLTLVAIGSMVPIALQAAQQLSADGVDVEVIDLRSLRPWDHALVVESARRTGRLATVHEAWVEGGFGAEVVASVVERVALRGRVVRVGAPPVPIPSGKLRSYALPDVDRLVAALRGQLAE
jgi:pyruvate/2-oxoglutarate/acetoin dehydrogenase E1 component